MEQRLLKLLKFTAHILQQKSLVLLENCFLQQRHVFSIFIISEKQG